MEAREPWLPDGVDDAMRSSASLGETVEGERNSQRPDFQLNLG